VIPFQPILSFSGAVLCVLAGTMLIPMGVDIVIEDRDWRPFAAAAAVTLFFGGAMLLATRGSGRRDLTLRHGFLLANFVWLTAALFSALPFAFSGLALSPIDALFESMSGLTTTGATVLNDIQGVPPGILLWRAMLSWLGGIGVILMAILLLPNLQVGGMQLFRIEAIASDRVLQRPGQIGAGIALLYVTLTFAGFVALKVAGLETFDALIHVMSAISTGGFSTHRASVAQFDSMTVEWIVLILMLLGAAPFITLLRAGSGQPSALWRDSQIKTLLGIVAAAATIVAIWMVVALETPPLTALSDSLFTVVSMMSGSGFRVTDLHAWEVLPILVLLCVMLIGGTAGSTSSGIKVFRIQILFSLGMAQLHRLTRPHGVFVCFFGGKRIPEEAADAVIGFIFLFFFTYVAVALGLGILGFDLLTALSVAVSALANVGPGFGDPLLARGSYAALSDAAKLWITLAMLLGRVEVLTALILLSRSFWRA